MNFRHDLNGLRAIAVIAVVLFHFTPSVAPGGFAGVDVFFVISGFLMTTIIFKGIENNSFNLFKFYVARANRIIPALSVLCLVLLVFGWFYLTPLDYQTLGKHVAGSMGFFSNVMYLRESGYFDISSHEKWLLHTWSLSVEWQFYIIYPVLLVALNRFLSIENLKKLLIIGTILGFGFCVFATSRWSNAAYYLLPTRAWEMMFGGIAYLYPMSIKETHKKLVESLGLALILISYIFISNENFWPGYLALFPVLGGYLIIIANRQDSLITNNVIFQSLGKWSYSIYIWHWPLVVFGLYFGLKIWWLYGLPLSVLLGFLSYKYVERVSFPSFYKWIDFWKIKPVWMLVIATGLGLAIFIKHGFEWHYSKQVIVASKESLNRNPYKCMTGVSDNTISFTHCYIGNKDNVKAIVIGDSHAEALTTSVASVFDLNKSGIIAITRSSCPFVLNAKSHITGDICYNENLLRLKDMQNYKGIPLVLIGRWPVYLYGQNSPDRIKIGDNRASMYFGDKKYMTESELLSSFSINLSKTLCSLTNNSPVFIVQPTPEMGRDIPKAMSKLLMVGTNDSDLSIDINRYYDRSNKIREIINKSAKSCGAVVLDPSTILCKDGKCIAQLKNRPIYYDGDHMSEFGNKLLTPMFSKALM